MKIPCRARRPAAAGISELLGHNQSMMIQVHAGVSPTPSGVAPAEPEKDFRPSAVLPGVPTDQAPRDGLPGHRTGSRTGRSTACLKVSQCPETAGRLPPSAHSPAARRGGCPIRPAIRIGRTAPRTAASQVGAAGGGVRTPSHHQGACGPAATPRTRCETNVPRSSSSCLTRETNYAGRTKGDPAPLTGAPGDRPAESFARQHRVLLLAVSPIPPPVVDPG
jgi:hypothetical protein